MKVTFRRSGGLAGISMAASTDTSALDAAVAGPLEQLFSGPAETSAASAPGPGADRFTYEIELADGPTRRSFSWPESSVPEAVRPAVQALNALSQPE